MRDRSHPWSLKVLVRSEADGYEKQAVLVSRDIWDVLISTDGGSESSARYIALAPIHSADWHVCLARPSSRARAETSIVRVPAAASKLCHLQTVVARSIQPVILESVYLTFAEPAYDAVVENLAILRQTISSTTVWVTGQSMEFDSMRGIIKLTEPVRQGIVDETTEFVVVRQCLNDEGLVISNGDSLARVNGSHSQPTELVPLTALDTLSGFEFRQVSLRSLQQPFDTLGSEPVAPLDDFTDSAYRAYGSVETLIRLGLFVGDWVEITLAPTETPSARLLRVYPLPLGPESDQLEVTLFLPPILLYNIGHSQSEPVGAYIQKSDRNAAMLPQAKAVNLSRVASPASTDRTLQDAIFDELRRYFESSPRLMRAGDLILLGIDEASARLTVHGDSTALEYANGSSKLADTFAWFKVTDVQVDGDSSVALGDVVVDSRNTRLVQQGFEQARIPPLNYWAGFYGLSNPAMLCTGLAGAQETLKNLIAATFSLAARQANASASVLLHGARGCGKTSIVTATAAQLGMHFFEINCFELVGESDIKTEAYLRIRFEKAAQCSPCILFLRNIDALAQKKDDLESGQDSAIRFVLADCIRKASIASGQFPLAIVGGTSDKDKLPDGVLGCFRHDLPMEAPDEGERFEIIKAASAGLELSPEVDLKMLAIKSAALVADDIVDFVNRSRFHALDRLESYARPSNSLEDLEIAGFWITDSDLEASIEEARRNYSDAIGAPKIPNVTWADVGGLAGVKNDILDTIQLPLERPELFASGMKKRSGILFYGPPGTGKTLLAKAVATSFSLNFFSVKGPELLNMYIGESEANVRRVFQRARDARPCVVFFDELDSVAPKRGNQGDSGGVMDRIVSQLLSELDGMAEGKDGGNGVFVIGATNRPDLLDPALLRPGRFDKMLYLGISETDEQQLNILQALTRKFRLHPDLDLLDVARKCPFTYTGADFYALCSDAMLKAMTRQAYVVDEEVKRLNATRTIPISTAYFFDHFATREHLEVLVTASDFFLALRELIPSVSQEELAHYKRVQAQFSPNRSDNDPLTDSGNNKGKGTKEA
ncbi:peroxisomal assembly protein [Savitreella phatthalungensis]